MIASLLHPNCHAEPSEARAHDGHLHVYSSVRWGGLLHGGAMVRIVCGGRAATCAWGTLAHEPTLDFLRYYARSARHRRAGLPSRSDWQMVADGGRGGVGWRST